MQQPPLAPFCPPYCLSGAVAPPHITDSLDSLEAVGADGNNRTGQYRSCWEGWPMRCRALCLGYCTTPSTIDKGVKGTVARHDICFGPLGSTCPYDCKPMFTPDGEMRCLPGDSAYQGGLCRQVFERGPGNPQNGNWRNESWYNRTWPRPATAPPGKPAHVVGV